MLGSLFLSSYQKKPVCNSACSPFYSTASSVGGSFPIPRGTKQLAVLMGGFWIWILQAEMLIKKQFPLHSPVLLACMLVGLLYRTAVRISHMCAYNNLRASFPVCHSKFLFLAHTYWPFRTDSCLWRWCWWWYCGWLCWSLCWYWWLVLITMQMNGWNGNLQFFWHCFLPCRMKWPEKILQNLCGFELISIIPIISWFRFLCMHSKAQQSMVFWTRPCLDCWLSSKDLKCYKKKLSFDFQGQSNSR